MAITALKPKHLKALKRAIEEAACWRGSMIARLAKDDYSFAHKGDQFRYEHYLELKE